MVLDETYTLNSGISIPKLGLGTWFIDDDKAAEAVRAAVKLGYRLIDTAQAYGNERGVGEGVCTCGVPREQLFVASKIAAELKTYLCPGHACVFEAGGFCRKDGLSLCHQRRLAGPYHEGLWEALQGRNGQAGTGCAV